MLPWRVCNQPIKLYSTRGATLLQISPHSTHQGKRKLKPAWGRTWEGCNEWEIQWQGSCCWDMICLTSTSGFLFLFFFTFPSCVSIRPPIRAIGVSILGLMLRLQTDFLIFFCWSVRLHLLFSGVCCKKIVDAQMDAKTYSILSMWYSEQVLMFCCELLIVFHFQ